LFGACSHNKFVVGFAHGDCTQVRVKRGHSSVTVILKDIFFYDFNFKFKSFSREVGLNIRAILFVALFVLTTVTHGL